MCSRAWTALVVVSMAAPALASGPVDTAARAPVAMDATVLMTRTRWVGTYYSPLLKPLRAELNHGTLREGSGVTPFTLRVGSGSGTAGPCDLIWGGFRYRAIYRLERDRFLICSGVRGTDPRPRTFAVTAHSDLFILEPAPGK